MLGYTQLDIEVLRLEVLGRYRVYQDAKAEALKTRLESIRQYRTEHRSERGVEDFTLPESPRESEAAGLQHITLLVLQALDTLLEQFEDRRNWFEKRFNLNEPPIQVPISLELQAHIDRALSERLLCEDRANPLTFAKTQRTQAPDTKVSGELAKLTSGVTLHDKTLALIDREMLQHGAHVLASFESNGSTTTEVSLVLRPTKGSPTQWTAFEKGKEVGASSVKPSATAVEAVNLFYETWQAQQLDKASSKVKKKS